MIFDLIPVVLSNLGFIAIFIAILFVLILVHEWGHFITAKKTGMRVDEFAIGFPPKLFGIKRGETEYTINALPIGGFVRIWGENFGADDDSETVDRSRSFSARPKWAQALVLVAGVVMNVILAWFLFILTFMIGVPVPVEESAAAPDAQLYIQAVISDGPAAALLPAGAEIIAVSAGGRSLDRLTPDGLTTFVTAVAPDPVMVTYVQGALEEQVEITPVAGLVAEDPARYLIGVRPVLIEIQSFGFVDSIVNGTTVTIERTVQIVVGLFTLLGQSIAGTADYSQVAGPVGIVGMVDDIAALGIVALLSFMAFISLNLAVINLLPLPALDGGRLVFVAIETVTGKEIPPEWAGKVNLFGFALLMLLMLVVTYNDILRLFS
jgi:regulator of sigma E protease